MSYFTIDGKYVRLYGKRASQSLRDLEFDVAGARFPEASFPGVELYENAKFFRVVSTRPNSILINYGDGATNTFSSAPSGSDHIIQINRAQEHLYTDGFTGRRIVVISIEDVKAVKEIYVQHVKLYGSVPANIDKLTELRTLRLNFTYQIERIIDSFINLPNLQNVLFGNTFKQGSELAKKIPDQYFNKPIIRFDNAHVDYAGVDSNMDRIAEWAPTLTYLSLSVCNLSVLPANFNQLVNLTVLLIDSNQWTETPDIVNAIPSLTRLSVGGGGHSSVLFTSYGDFSNLTNLAQLYAYYAPNITTTIPAWLASLIKLKIFRLDNSFLTVARVDEFIDNFYSFVTTEAPMSGTSVDPFRNMSVNVINKHPSGIYQQPAGYVAGSSNGTPASPLEKVWVMVNQYAHSWTYTP